MPQLPTSFNNHHSRQFLNPAGVGGLAAILTEVRDGDQDEDYMDFMASLTLSDENDHTASLDFGVYGRLLTLEHIAELRAELENASRRAMNLRAQVNTFVDSLNAGLIGVADTLDAAERIIKKG